MLVQALQQTHRPRPCNWFVCVAGSASLGALGLPEAKLDVSPCRRQVMLLHNDNARSAAGNFQLLRVVSQAHSMDQTLTASIIVK